MTSSDPKLQKNPDSEARILSLRNTGMSIGNNVFIDEGVWIEQVYPDKIVIEDHVIIAAGAKILCHDSALANLYNLPIKVSKVILKRNCYIGAGAIIMPGVTVHKKAIVGAGSIVTKDVPSETVVAGNPASKITTTSELISKYRSLEQSNPDIFDYIRSPYFPAEDTKK